MFFNDVFSTIGITFLISMASIIIFFIATVLFIIFFKKNHDKKLIVGYLVVVLLSVFGAYISLPWIFLNEALHQTDNKLSVAYYDTALKTAIFPKVKATVYDMKAAHYFTVEKNLPLAIENCEKFNLLKGDLPGDCGLWDMYIINKDYDKAIEQLKQKNMTQMKAIVYLLKGETSTAIEVMNNKIKINPKAWDYAYRANFYDYKGNSNLAQKDYQKALELNPNMSNYPNFKAMRANKNYFFDRLKQNRKEYNLD